jgi:hypothetical protein
MKYENELSCSQESVTGPQSESQTQFTPYLFKIEFMVILPTDIVILLTFVTLLGAYIYFVYYTPPSHISFVQLMLLC